MAHKPAPSRVIGVDPDTAAHGVAIYENGRLVELKELTLVEIIKLVQSTYVTKWVIEDLRKNNFIYGRNDQHRKGGKNNKISQDLINQKIMLNVGQCKQSMIELVRVLEAYGQTIQLVPPTKDNWADDTKRFKRLTGWTKRSNPDKRSAAYFGFLGV